VKVAVLGAGAGGTTLAFDYAAHGHEVSLFDFPQFPGNIEVIADQGGIHAEGDISGFSKIAYAGHDIEPFGQALAGKLQPGQTVIVSPSSCGGALAFKRAAGLVLEDDSIRVAETSTLHYAVRLVAPGRVHVFLKLKAGNLLSALPGSHTAEILQLINDVYPGMEPAHNVLQTSLQNANPVIHPVVTLSNAARIEATGGDFLFYEEGVSDSVGRLIQAVDRERIAIGKQIGITVAPDPEMGMRQGYMLENNYGTGYREAPGFLGIGAQPTLDHRYLNEDVGYGLVFMSNLARQIGVDTPTIDSVIQMASVLMDRDYATEALRTPRSLGIGDYSLEELGNL